MSFLNCTKYPPSLLFLLMTIGPSIILLSVLENVKTDAKKYFLVFGKTPLFFYLIHVPVIHLFAVLIATASGLNITFLFDNSYPETWPAEFGYGLIGVYIIWIIVVVLLYPINKWFMKLKHEKKNRWLSYF